MRRTISLELLSHVPSFGVQGAGSSNKEALRVAKEVLRKALEQELTARQLQCVRLYFFEELTEEEVGLGLGISKSTVCRHLQRAKKRLSRAVSYAGEAYRAVLRGSNKR